MYLDGRIWIIMYPINTLYIYKLVYRYILIP